MTLLAAFYGEVSRAKPARRKRKTKMKYLLDTAVWLWSVDSPERIGDEGREIIERGRGRNLPVGGHFLGNQHQDAALGKLRLPGPPAHHVPRFMAKQGLRPLSVTHSHAAKVYDLPPHHRDPFDRMLIAQAMVEDMVILTSDRSSGNIQSKLLWCGS